MAGTGTVLQPITPQIRLAGQSGVVAARPRRAAPGGGAAPNFQDNGGTIIQIVKLHLVYWGNAWISNPPPNPSPGQIDGAADTILASSYMTGLTQYRQIGRGYRSGSTVVSNSNPPNPFSNNDVGNFVGARIQDGTLPPVDLANQNLYMVVMPQGANSGGFLGEHSFFTDANSHNVHFGWVTNNGNIDTVTEILSHELVESCSDPEGSAILGTAGTCNQGGWCEIGDVCVGNNDRVDGVAVQRYWSQADGTCIAPQWAQETFPQSGVQWRDVLPAGSVVTWFTYNWPEYYFVLWDVVPTTPRPGAAEVTWKVHVERASGAFITYWIEVTNLTNVDIEIEGRFSILGR